MQARAFLLLAPALVLVTTFVLFPLGWITRISFNENIPGGYMRTAWILKNYTDVLGSLWYLKNMLWFSVYMTLIATVIATVLSYPIAIYIAKARGVEKNILVTLVLSPLLIGLVTLVYGWIVIFRGGGLLNSLMMTLRVYDEPVQYMWNNRGILILLVYVGMPYMIMSLLDSIERINPSLEEAARNVGASRWTTFWRVTFPLTTPGLYAGLLILLALTFAAFAVPLMVGPDDSQMIGLVIYREALFSNNLPKASSISIIMIATNAAMIMIIGFIFGRLFFRKLEARQ
jgi:putative spermidine/putrescine transport system permease protein